jgi:hypothetical protein
MTGRPRAKTREEAQAEYTRPVQPSPEKLRMRLLEPGWAGELDDDELTYITTHIRDDVFIRRMWGFRQNAKRLATAAIRRVAEFGNPERARDNRKLVRGGP